MKIKVRRSRRYRQTARATAAEATGQRILESVLHRVQHQWLEEVTLDAVAKDAGVTVQTVIRRFGPKERLLEAAAQELDKGITGRRGAEVGAPLRAVDVLAADYEVVGDLVWRLLAQEERYPVLQKICDRGRYYHRDWLSRVFSPWLDGLERRAATQRLDALVAATDLYLWKLLRRDLSRSVNAYKGCVVALLRGALPLGAIPEEPSVTPRRRSRKEPS